MLELINRDRAERLPQSLVILRVNWVLAPSLNFYRVTRGYTWLMRVRRQPITRSEADYIYAYESEVKGLLVDTDTRLASFPDIGTVLVRLDQPTRPESSARPSVGPSR